MARFMDHGVLRRAATFCISRRWLKYSSPQRICDVFVTGNKLGEIA